MMNTSPEYKAAQNAVIQSADVLNAIRPQATVVVGSTDQIDESIQKAWKRALDDFRTACDEFVKVMK